MLDPVLFNFRGVPRHKGFLSLSPDRKETFGVRPLVYAVIYHKSKTLPQNSYFCIPGAQGAFCLNGNCISRGIDGTHTLPLVPMSLGGGCLNSSAEALASLLLAQEQSATRSDSNSPLCCHPLQDRYVGPPLSGTHRA